MSALKTDTIAALATPPGKSSVAMFRVSGEGAFAVCDTILKHRKPCEQYSTQTLHRALVAEGNDTVDDVLVAVFHAPRSYTGEDIVEITCHGGAVPIRRIMALLLGSGARLAEPGEFTLRAYLNGKLDLAQAEAVCDTIDARTDEGYRQAQAQQSGKLSAEANSLRDSLLGIVARIEASIDFPEDVGDFPTDWCRAELSSARSRLAALIGTAGRGMLFRDGIAVVLAGKPNAGKSSLLNALLRADRAIVTAIPGTTRDTIEESIDIKGIPVRLIDTAGLREAQDEIERIGIERSRSSLLAADIVLVVKDSTAPDTQYGTDEIAIGAPCIEVWNKIDLLEGRSGPQLPGGVAVSAATGEGIERLEEAIADLAFASGGGGMQGRQAESGAAITQARHLHALQEALGAVDRALDALDISLPLDFLSIEAQSALSAIGLITGETAPQEIVNEIFHRFCIGK